VASPFNVDVVVVIVVVAGRPSSPNEHVSVVKKSIVGTIGTVTEASVATHVLMILLLLLESISSTFYAHIFCTKVHLKPNSKQRKAAQKTFM
jgi:hypothetical protein